jgi:hypothetical protein
MLTLLKLIQSILKTLHSDGTAELEAQLKRLTAGVAPGIKLPKIKL